MTLKLMFHGYIKATFKPHWGEAARGGLYVGVLLQTVMGTITLSHYPLTIH